MRIYRRPYGGTKTMALDGAARTTRVALRVTSTNPSSGVRYSGPLSLEAVRVTPTLGAGVSLTGDVEIAAARKLTPSTPNEWVARNPNKIMKYQGKWVVVTHKGIQATGKSMEEVYRTATKRGISNPLVFKVSKPSGPRAVSARAR